MRVMSPKASAAIVEPGVKAPRELEPLFKERGFPDFRWIGGRQVVTGEWVRLKCMFGCKGFSTRACCPPNVPSVKECRRFFDGYSAIAVFHFRKAVTSREERHAWGRAVNESLLALEREVFLRGYYKAFLLFMDACRLCPECAGTRERCRNPASARPGIDALGVDVFATVRSLDYPIEVLSEHSQPMNRYAFLLVD
jgi:predicted metal-binding protein